MCSESGTVCQSLFSFCTHVFRERGGCQDPATRPVPAKPLRPLSSSIRAATTEWYFLLSDSGVCLDGTFQVNTRHKSDKFFQGWSVSKNRWLAYWAKMHNIVFSCIQKPPRVSSVHRHTVSFAGPWLGPLTANPKAISLNASALGSETNLVFVVFPGLFGLWWFGNGNAQLQCGNQSGGGNHLHSHTQRFPSQGYL